MHYFNILFQNEAKQNSTQQILYEGKINRALHCLTTCWGKHLFLLFLPVIKPIYKDIRKTELFFCFHGTKEYQTESDLFTKTLAIAHCI